MYKSFLTCFILVWGLFLESHGWCGFDSSCNDDQDCMFVGITQGRQCVNVCGEDACGRFMDCTAANHEKTCSCKEGYEANRNGMCYFVKETCGKCGANTSCTLYENRAFCGCKEGFSGNPYDKNDGCVKAPGLVDAAKCWSEDRDEPSPDCIRYFNQRPKKYFTIMEDKATWFKAQNLCQVEGRMLAIVESRLDQQSLETAIINKGIRNEKFWLAGSDIKMSGTPQWVYGNTFNSIEFSNWNPGEPGGQDQRCVAMTENFSWSSEDCLKKFRFICQNK